MMNLFSNNLFVCLFCNNHDQKYKKLLLHHIESDTFTIGCNAVKKKLGWPLDVDLKKKPADIPEGYRLFVQSTSANRVIKPGAGAVVCFRDCPARQDLCRLLAPKTLCQVVA